MTNSSTPKLPDLLTDNEYYKLCREDAAYKLDDVADELEITRSRLQNWESGSNAVSPAELRRWRKGLFNLLATRLGAIKRHMRRLSENASSNSQ
jgi:transcriptional regulator with XRE-family HTH domain